MEPGNVDSHIQMPRFLLARFENEHHRINVLLNQENQ